MTGILFVIVVILLTVSRFYLKGNVLTSFTNAFIAIFAAITSMGFYESIADILISKGKGGQWAIPIMFIMLFALSFIVMKVIADLLIKTQVEFNAFIKAIVNIICGLITGVTIAGILLITFAMAPLPPKMPYERFTSNSGIIQLTATANPKKAFMNIDGIVTNLFTWISKGSLSSSNSFALYRADFLDQLHLNHFKAKEESIAIANKECIVIPKDGVKILDDGMTIVKIGIKSGDIEKGGAADPDGKVAVTLGQIRMICTKRSSDGINASTGRVIYPQNYLAKNVKEKDTPPSLSRVITFERKAFVASPHGRVAWLEVAFDVPTGYTPTLLQFKHNVIVKLPKPRTEQDIMTENQDLE